MIYTILNNKIMYQDKYNPLAMLYHFNLKESFSSSIFFIYKVILYNNVRYSFENHSRVLSLFVKTFFCRHVLKVSISLLWSGFPTCTY
jgi:hypothetical protein